MAIWRKQVEARPSQEPSVKNSGIGDIMAWPDLFCEIDRGSGRVNLRLLVADGRNLKNPRACSLPHDVVIVCGLLIIP